MAPLIQLQTRFISYNSFTIKALLFSHLKSFYYEAASQETLCFQQQKLNTTPESDDDETVEHSSRLENKQDERNY